MLWSLVKILIFVTLVASVTYGAGLLLETDGVVRLAVGSTEFTLSPLAAVIFALLMLGVVWALFRLVGLSVAVLKFAKGDETAISRFFLRNRERRGFEALTEGLMALASGEGRLALTKATKAEKFLNRPELTNLIAAQAAEMAGDSQKAEEAYKRLLQDDRTRFVGVRGIMKQKLALGETATALKLAEKAFALKPKHEETQDILLRLQTEADDWHGARSTLATKLRSGALPRDVHKRRDAVLTYAEARDALAEGKIEKAAELSIEANRLAPHLIPAAALAGRMQVEIGKPKNALKVLKKAWEITPHPDIAASFAAMEPSESPVERVARFAPLINMHPDHVESRMLKAELEIAAENFPEARRALGDLYETAPTARSLTIMAAIERGAGAPDSLVRAFLARALTASRGSQWVCDKCHNIHGDWLPICSTCGAFDTLSWVEPPKSEMALPNSSEMLPLIVGAIEDKAEVTQDIEVAEELEPAQTSPVDITPAEEEPEADEKAPITKD